MSAWTKRSKTSGDFMAVKKPAAKKKGRQKVQGRAAGEDVKVKVFDFLEVVITAAAMAAAVNSFERALGVPGALEEFGGDALPRFMAGQFNRKRSQALLGATSIFATLRSSKARLPVALTPPIGIVPMQTSHALGSATVGHDSSPGSAASK